MSEEHLLNYFFLIADADRDRAVSSADYNIMSANFGYTGRNFSQGDFDLQGDVDLDDFSILAANFGRQVPAPLTGKNECVASALSSSANRIEWTEPDGTPDGYRIFRSLDGINFTQIAQVGTSSLTYDDTGLQDGTKYWYRVRPYTTANGNGESTNKFGTPTVMNAPSGVSVSAFHDSDGSGVSITWANNSVSATQFVIQRAENSGFTTNLQSFSTQSDGDSSSVGFFRDTTVSPGTTYYYRVSAHNDDTYSASVTAASSVTAATPPPNIPRELTPYVQSASSVQLRWLDASTNETGFQIERSTTDLFESSNTTQLSVGANATSYTDTLAQGGKYYYRIRSISSTDSSAWSYAAPVDTTAQIASPGDVSMKHVDNDALAVEWTDNNDSEDGYRIYRSSDPAFPSEETELVAEVGRDTTSVIDEGVDTEATWYYRVEAFQASNEAISDIADSSAALENTGNNKSYIQFLRETGDGYSSISDTSTATNIGSYTRGFAVHVRVSSNALLALGDEFGTKYRYTWDFGAGEGAHRFQKGLNASFVYSSNGTKSIRLRVEGAPTSGSSTVVHYDRALDVTISNRSEVASTTPGIPTSPPSATTFLVYNVSSAGTTPSGYLKWDDVLAAKPWESRDRVIVRFRLGEEFIIPTTTFVSEGAGIDLSGRKYSVFEAEGTPSGTQTAPRLKVEEITSQNTSAQRDLRNRYIFQTNSASRAINIKGLVLTSDYDEAVTATSAGHAEIRAPRGIHVNGNNFSIRGCEFGYLGSGVYDEDTERPYGVLIQECKTFRPIEAGASEDDYAIPYGNQIYLSGVQGLLINANNLRNSYHEHTIRLNRSNKYVNIIGNYLRKQNGGSGDVAPLTDRGGTSSLRVMAGIQSDPTNGASNERALFHVSGNELRGGQIFLGPLGGVSNDFTRPTEKTFGMVFADNFIQQGAFVELMPGLQQAVIRNNVFVPATGQAAMRVNGRQVMLGSTVIAPSEQVVRDVAITHNTVVYTGSSQGASFLLFDNPNQSTARDYYVRMKAITLQNNLVTSFVRADGAYETRPGFFAVQMFPLFKPPTGTADKSWASVISGTNGVASSDKWTIGDNNWNTPGFDLSSATSDQDIVFRIDLGANATNHVTGAETRLTVSGWNNLVNASNAGEHDKTRDIQIGRQETADIVVTGNEYRPINFASSPEFCSRRINSWFDIVQSAVELASTESTVMRSDPATVGAREI
ncbi:MAG TPA: hypothetical protein PLD59_05110 [Tepidisphaeraceae bacterium]|nr:hypothetical protein [Tepidisphaeraceae bacterium]